MNEQEITPEEREACAAAGSHPCPATRAWPHGPHVGRPVLRFVRALLAHGVRIERSPTETRAVQVSRFSRSSTGGPLKGGAKQWVKVTARSVPLERFGYVESMSERHATGTCGQVTGDFLRAPAGLRAMGHCKHLALARTSSNGSVPGAGLARVRGRDSPDDAPGCRPREAGGCQDWLIREGPLSPQGIQRA